VNAYRVTLSLPDGEAVVDLLASSPDLAKKRAWLTAVHAGWGDVDDVTATTVTPITREEFDAE